VAPQGIIAREEVQMTSMFCDKEDVLLVDIRGKGTAINSQQYTESLTKLK
jgi:hypothetical protein